ncbi:NADH pyrophosphatase [Minicystis rosea]|nr:NADH pyrophosphatase [Minicystis rosea]
MPHGRALAEGLPAARGLPYERRVNPIDRNALCFAFRGRDLVVSMEGDAVRVLDAATFTALGFVSVRQNDLGIVDGHPSFAVELAEDVVLPEGTAALGLRRLWTSLGEADFRRAGRAVQIVEWDRSHQWCGRCGGPTERVPSELSRRCPRCGLSFYPRISPAVIVLVTRGNEVLLGRNARFPGRMYSTLAGFVEVGETLEETVAREIREEVGIEVENIRYFGSQPWPFPDSLMIGFTAEHAGGTVRPDPSELSDAGWFTIDTLPPIPPRLSIARALIDDWVRRMGGDPDALQTAG